MTKKMVRRIVEEHWFEDEDDLDGVETAHGDGAGGDREELGEPVDEDLDDDEIDDDEAG